MYGSALNARAKPGWIGLGSQAADVVSAIAIRTYAAGHTDARSGRVALEDLWPCSASRRVAQQEMTYG